MLGSIKNGFEIRRLVPDDAHALADFFSKISVDSASERFHPHPFDNAHALKIASWVGRDIYVGVFASGQVIGYGMLRGWDEGWQVPSLGICILPAMRGKGLSVPLMQKLHDMARHEGAERIRLKVYTDNHVAMRIYEQLGYRFMSEEHGQKVGLLDLVSK